MQLKFYFSLIYFLLILYSLFCFNTKGSVILGIFIEDYQFFILMLTLIVAWLIMEFMPFSLIKFTSYYLLIKVLFIFLLLFFISSSFMWFFMWFEFSMLPVFFMMLILGSNPERLKAALLMMIYTMVGGVPLLISVIFLNFKMLSLDFYLLKFISGDMNYLFNITNSLFFVFLILGFMIKVPLFGFHHWLPSVHVESPVGGSMILAAMMIKMGSFGLYRLSYINFLFNSYSLISLFNWVLIGKVILSFMIFRLMDLKSVMAFSSIMHMSLSFLCLFNLSYLSFIGLILLIVSHGLVSSGLFYSVKYFYSHTSSRSILFKKGFNLFCFSLGFFFFFLLFKMSFPPFMSFLGEFLLFNSVVSFNFYSFMILMLVFLLVGLYKVYIFSVVGHGKGYSNKYLKINNQMMGYKGMFLHLVTYLVLLLILKFMF